MERNETIVNFIKSLYPEMNPVLLHCPQFLGNEKKYLNECIDTKFVSYVSHFVTDLEEHVKKLTGAKFAVAMVNGTEALHMAFASAGIKSGVEVITQAVTFAATSAALVHMSIDPVYVDVEKETLGMSPVALKNFLENNTVQKDGKCIDKNTNKEIAACTPVHIFGHPCKIDEIKSICDEHNIMLIEDAAESIGSFYKNKHTGTFGKVSALSFNGNKTLTTGGGGMLITDDEQIAARAKYISTTAKRPSRWEYYHEEAGWNLRMPGLNAAVGCAQMEYFDKIISNKRETAQMYKKFFDSIGVKFFTEPADCKSNYWLNAILLENREEREKFLEYTNDNGVQTRPIWTLMYKMPPYAKFYHDSMENSQWLEDHLVNIPSSVRTSTK